CFQTFFLKDFHFHSFFAHKKGKEHMFSLATLVRIQPQHIRETLVWLDVIRATDYLKIRASPLDWRGKKTAQVNCFFLNSRKHIQRIGEIHAQFILLDAQRNTILIQLVPKIIMHRLNKFSFLFDFSKSKA
ncbi:hypothetical protein ACJX0J_036948, partial [Zea mays]